MMSSSSDLTCSNQTVFLHRAAQLVICWNNMKDKFKTISHIFNFNPIKVTNLLCQSQTSNNKYFFFFFSSEN